MNEDMPDKPSASDLLGLTAWWAAHARAKESRRADRLFNDHWAAALAGTGCDDLWAAALAGTESKEWVEQWSNDDGVSTIVRTRFFDDFLQRVTDQDAIRQVVLMAAGLDTRAFRLNWPAQTHLFELDQPRVLKHKGEVLAAAAAQPTCERQTVAVDLTGPWREMLLKTGFNPQQPSLWLLEGLLVYLPNDNIARLLDEIASLSTPGSWIGFDITNSAVLTSPWTQQWVEIMNQAGMPWLGTMDDPETFLATRGWKATPTQFGEQEANYGRWPHPVAPRPIPDIPRHWFVIAQKNQPGERSAT